MGEETEILEFKTSTAEIPAALDSIVAILNKHQKGTLYFGVKNNGTPIGQQMGANTLRDVTRAITDHIEPKIYPTVEKVVLDGKDCIKVEFEGNDIPYFSHGRAYIRVGDEDKKMSQKQLKRLIFTMEENNNRWEEKPSNANYDDIDEDTLKKFVDKGRKKGRISYEYTNKEEVLKRLNLVDENGKIKNAGYVLFAKEPNIQLRVAIFATEEKTTFLDMQDFTGNVFELIDKGEQYISKNIRWSANFNTGSFTREDIPEIPIRAMREILCNSFCHRNWNEPFENNIAIYKDRIEICNPGHFTSEATPEDYIKKTEPSRPRNPLIAQTIYLSGEIEKWGTGIKNVYNKCKEENLKVKFEDRKTAFFVIIYRKDLEGLIENTEKDLKNDNINVNINDTINVNIKLNKTEKTILEMVINNPNITQSEIAEKLNITKVTVNRNINKLKEKNIIKRIGANKNGYWKIIK